MDGKLGNFGGSELYKFLGRVEETLRSCASGAIAQRPTGSTLMNLADEAVCAQDMVFVFMAGTERPSPEPLLDSDPTGRTAHDPGAKLDAGKLQAGLLLDFANALEAVAKIATYGAKKYSAGGWLQVPDGLSRYADAEMRHKLARAKGEQVDQESGLAHRWHEVWNALAQLELELRHERQESETSPS